MKKFLIVLILLGLGAGGAGLWYVRSGNGSAAYRTAPVERGPLVANISATGTVEPEEVVDVGAQVAGQIKTFGRDPGNSSKSIDYRSQVEEGTVLAQIEDAMYAAEVEEAKADLAYAVASVQRTEAELVQLRAKLYQAERDWNRAKKLSPSNAISPLEYDTIQNTYETAKAAVPAGEAALVQTQRAVDKSRAALKKAETNLGYTTIRSPVKGVIIERRVNIGQTVVANLNAPSLFLIAKDLKKLQVWASVNEADIGHIHKGQKVRFTVDAHPYEVFDGEVGLIRLNATMTQNVVTYTVVVNTDNSSGRLLPYATANLQFLVSEKDNVVQVPNASLRWRPRMAQVAPDARAAYAKALRRKGGSSSTKVPAEGSKGQAEQGMVWVEDGGHVRPVMVQTGLTDGIMTEIAGGDLQEGMEVIMGEERQENGDGTTNPFTTPMFGGNKPQQRD